MARFLLACYPVSGHVFPNIALGHALADRGHDVAIYTGSMAKSLVEGEGFTYFPYDAGMDRAISDTLLTRDGSSGAASMSVRRAAPWDTRQINATMQAWFLDTVPQQVDDLQAAIADWQPDVLVSDISLFAPPLILRDKLALPVAMFCVLIACPLPGADAPTWGRGLPSPTTWRGRLQSRFERTAQNWALSDFRAAGDALRKRYGLPALEETMTANSGKVPLYLVASAPELDYNRRDLPASVRYVGPCLWHRPGNEAVPDWLAAYSRRTRPVVHVTEGTIHLRKPVLLGAAVEGLDGLDMDVIMTTGKQRDPDALDLGAIADNIRIEQFVSHGDLFPNTDVVVTTGGAGTVLTALANGVPLVVVPTAWDLPESAQRVAESGAGIRINPKDCTPQRLREAVELLLTEPSYRTNARRIGDALARQGGPSRAAELLENLHKPMHRCAPSR